VQPDIIRDIAEHPPLKHSVDRSERLRIPMIFLHPDDLWMEHNGLVALTQPAGARSWRSLSFFQAECVRSGRAPLPDLGRVGSERAGAGPEDQRNA
jgi:hypothetical protein